MHDLELALDDNNVVIAVLERLLVVYVRAMPLIQGLVFVGVIHSGFHYTVSNCLNDAAVNIRNGYHRPDQALLAVLVVAVQVGDKSKLILGDIFLVKSTREHVVFPGAGRQKIRVQSFDKPH